VNSFFFVFHSTRCQLKSRQAKRKRKKETNE